MGAASRQSRSSRLACLSRRRGQRRRSPPPGPTIAASTASEVCPRARCRRRADDRAAGDSGRLTATKQSNFASASIRPNGSFAIEGIYGPRRLEVLTAPPGWALKEIRTGGINVTDQVLPFGTTDESLRDVEVVLTDRVSELIGSVRDDRARPMASATIIVFSTDRSHWYPRSRYARESGPRPMAASASAGCRPGSTTRPRCATYRLTATRHGRNRYSWSRSSPCP
jgi:hypothetical protein